MKQSRFGAGNRRLFVAGLLSVFALSLAADPVLARGGAGDGRNDPFVDEYKSSAQTRRAEKAARTQRAGVKREAPSEEPNFIERLLGASAKDGAVEAQSQ